MIFRARVPILVLCVFLLPPVAPRAGAAESSETVLLESIRADLVARVNEERLRVGLEPFSREPALDRAAQQAALEMGETARTDPEGRDQTFGLTIELSGWLAEGGYEARRAAAQAVVTEMGSGAETPPLLEDVLFTGASREFEGGLLDPGFRDLGVGLAGAGTRQVIVLVSALSRADEFQTLSGPLGDLERVRTELLGMSNSARSDHGRRQLRRDSCLERVAQLYADEMLTQSFYGHVSPNGLDPHERARAGRCFNHTIAENLAQGPVRVEETIAGWLASPGHRANLLNRKMNRVGFGVAFGQNNEGFQILWVQVLGSS